MLNPQSSQLSALVFKTLVVLEIAILDLLLTYPSVNGFQIFSCANGVISSIFFMEFLARLCIVTEIRRYRHLRLFRAIELHAGSKL